MQLLLLLVSLKLSVIILYVDKYGNNIINI